MYYHVIIESKDHEASYEFKKNLSEEKLRSQFINPYENNDYIVVNGRSIIPVDIERITICKTELSSFVLYSKHRFDVFTAGEDVTEDFIQGPPGYKKKKNCEKLKELKCKSNRIFVVCGHDDGMKQTVARTLEKLDLKPIILHEQPNQGRTIIEKFEEYADSVFFAVVLLSPDDKGYKNGQSSEAAKFRARQNVILELGFFLGKLGRNNVAALFKNDPNFEFPSDYDGVLYTPFDDSGKWRFELVQELKSSGYSVDANRLLS